MPIFFKLSSNLIGIFVMNVGSQYFKTYKILLAVAKVEQAYKIVNRPCIALDADFRIDEFLAYHDGNEIYYFYGKHPGNLSYKIQGLDKKEKWSDLWYIFKLKGFEKNLVEMNEKERENRRRVDGSYSALKNFAEWYEKNN